MLPLSCSALSLALTAREKFVYTNRLTAFALTQSIQFRNCDNRFFPLPVGAPTPQLMSK